MRDALPALVSGLAADVRMTRVWVGLGSTWAQEQVVGSTNPTVDARAPGPHSLLRRGPDQGQVAWVRPGARQLLPQDGETGWRSTASSLSMATRRSVPFGQRAIPVWRSQPVRRHGC